MKVLMISLDEGLLGRGELGDVVTRHKKYGRHVDTLDIIVFARHDGDAHNISGNVTSYPVKSSRSLFTAIRATRLGKKLCKDVRYDLIVTQDIFFTGLAGVRLSKLFKTKLLIHLHGDYINNSLWLIMLSGMPMVSV